MGKLLTYLLAILVVVVGIWWLMSRPANAPVVTVTPSPTNVAEQNITITSPANNAVVTSPILVTGKARVFENQFIVEATDMQGRVIVKNQVMSDAKDAGLFGKYTTQLVMPDNSPADFKIVAYSFSPKGDGSYEGYAEVKVHLKPLLIQ